jgi:hypothetical protein
MVNLRGLQDGLFLHQMCREMEGSPYTVLHTILYCLQYSGHYMYHQIWYYVQPTQCIYVFLCGSQNKQRLFPYTTLTDWIL